MYKIWCFEELNLFSQERINQEKLGEPIGTNWLGNKEKPFSKRGGNEFYALFIKLMKLQ